MCLLYCSTGCSMPIHIDTRGIQRRTSGCSHLPGQLVSAWPCRGGDLTWRIVGCDGFSYLSSHDVFAQHSTSPVDSSESCFQMVLDAYLTLREAPNIRGYFLFLSLYFIGDRVFLCNLDCPGTHLVDQVGLELTEIHLPLPPRGLN